jgi:hypothetical protein
VAQVINKRFSAVFGFSSDAEAQRAAGLIKKAGAAPRRAPKAAKRARKAKKSRKK